MKIYFSFLLILISQIVQSQPKFEIISQKANNTVDIFVSNDEFSPITIQVNLSLENLKSSNSNLSAIVIPARTKGFFITKLIKENESLGYHYSYKCISNFGDATIDKYDSNYVYELPFNSSNSIKVQQGYFGKYTHKNEKALDFDLPEGTEVLAAREGIVIAITQHNKIYCPSEKCLDYNNYVNILHPDGTIANYSHLKQFSVNPKVGDFVLQGQPIAKSGRTGFTTGPHLHFTCYLPGLEKNKTIDTYFKIKDGLEISILEENVFYSKKYSTK